MQFAREGNILAVRLERGEKVAESLRKLMNKAEFRGGYVLGGIGMLKDVELGYFVGDGEYDTTVYEEPAELLSLQGNLSFFNGDPQHHLHAIFGEEDFSTYGGHFVEGVVEVTLEISVFDTDPGIEMKREVEEPFQLAGLKISQRSTDLPYDSEARD